MTADQLETQLELLLRGLGRRERQLEEAIELLVRDMRAAFRAGNTSLGEKCENAIAAARIQLKQLAVQIAHTESKLYGIRTRKARDTNTKQG